MTGGKKDGSGIPRLLSPTLLYAPLTAVIYGKMLVRDGLGNLYRSTPYGMVEELCDLGEPLLEMSFDELRERSGHGKA